MSESRSGSGRGAMPELGNGPGSVGADAAARPAGYRAAVDDAAVFERDDRVLLLVEGRAPGRMLTGIASGRMPPPPGGAADSEPREIATGEAPYSTILTPKGKLVTDLRLIRLEAGEEGAFLLDVPRAGLDGLLDHLKRYMPPRFAKIVEPPEPLAMLTVTGEGAAHLISREAFGLRLGAEELEVLAEGDERVRSDGSRTGLRAIRSGEVHPPAFDLVGPAAELGSLRARFAELRLAAPDSGVLETLRIERGRPRYGVELDVDTLPPEAGIDRRAIDHTKGCYTGQEVIVRIRDRGRVNRHLRGFLMGDHPLPAAGTPLFIEGRERAAGEIRSATVSPRFEQPIALGYLRREAEPPTTARLGAPDGPEIGVRALADEGWVN